MAHKISRINNRMMLLNPLHITKIENENFIFSLTSWENKKNC